MARFFSGLFGSKKQTQQPSSALHLTTSVQGIPIPFILAGQNRLGANVIWTAGFTAVQQQSQGGKGGAVGGGGKGSAGAGGYLYSTDIIFAVCEGPVAGIVGYFVNGAFTAITSQTPITASAALGSGGTVLHVSSTANITVGQVVADLTAPSVIPSGTTVSAIGVGTITLSQAVTGAGVGLGDTIAFGTLFGAFFDGFLDILEEVTAANTPIPYSGSYSQTDWGFLDAQFPSQALAYRGIAYVAFDQLQLGSSPDVPQFNWEVLSTFNTAIPGQPDGDPKDALIEFLTNQFFGLGFPSSRLDQQMTAYSSYCRALGLVVSPVVASSVQAGSFLQDLLTATNADAAWYNGFLTVVPRGDQQVVAGTQQSITETHIVPVAGTAPVSNPPPYAVIVPGFVGSFVADLGVKYDGSGIPFTFTTAYPPASAGQYTIIAPGWYVFNGADIGQTVDISYNYSAVATYTPNLTPLFDFTTDEFLPNQGTIGQGVGVTGKNAIIVVRKPRDQMLNSIKLTYHDRTNNYNPTLIEVKDEASIVTYKRYRPSDTKDLTFFCLSSAAQQSAMLQLIREQIPTTFQWTAGKAFILCTVTSLVTLTGPTGDGRQLFRQLVRIIEVQENADSTLTFTAELFPGTAAAPQFGVQASQGFLPNYNADPGSINNPILFEPTDELGQALISGGGLMIAAAVSGQNLALWGGAKVFASYDNQNYTYVGSIYGPARMGVTTADFPSSGVNPTGQTIDQVHTLSVDLSESDGTLNSGSTIDATSLNTKCYVGPINGPGEIIAYQTATLTGANKYNLIYLVRGAFGTEDEIADHPSGSFFARLDGSILAIPYDQSRVGSTLFLKFCSFNIYQGGLQSLDAVSAFSYVIQGTALASPLPNVENLYSNYEAGFQKIYWDEITDFRNGIVYEIRQGPSWVSAQFIRTQAHPPFIAQGNGTFWIAARCQPIAGLTVYSEIPSEIVISGNQLSLNLLAGWDEKATNWQGTFDNGIGVSGPPFGGGLADIRLGGASNILAESILLQSTTASASLAAGGTVLSVASTSNISVGQAANDLTHPSVIPGGTTVTAIGSGTVTLSNAVTGAGVSNGDTLVFCDPDVLSEGGIIQDTALYYTIPSSHVIKTNGSSGAIVNASVNATVGVVGVPVGQNILAVTNILTFPDILASADTQYVDGWVEINVSQDGGSTWGGWQKFVPGVFPGNAWNFRFGLETEAASIIAFGTAFNFTVQLPPRIDHYQNQTINSGGTTITFQPDGAGSPAPFNGGPAGSPTPYYSVSWQAQTGDTYVVSNLSLTSLTIQFFNSVGSPVTRTGVNITVEGF